MDSTVDHENKELKTGGEKNWILLGIINKSKVIVFVFGISTNEVSNCIPCPKKFNFSIFQRKK